MYKIYQQSGEDWIFILGPIADQTAANTQALAQQISSGQTCRLEYQNTDTGEIQIIPVV